MSDNTPAVPPSGWSHFGTHLDYGGPLEFSKSLDDEGYPLWERPVSSRDALVVLADMLDKARMVANANDTASHDSGVYGHISRALQDTLLLVTTDASRAESVYAAIVSSGITVTEALERTAGNAE